MKKLLSKSQSQRMPVIRIAPVCNGKIYVIPQHASSPMDLPLEGYSVSAPVKHSNKLAKQLIDRFHQFIRPTNEPRFSVRYISPESQKEVYLYILPLRDEKEISFAQGKFVSAEEINSDSSMYSHCLQQESNLLGMAAELWAEYYFN